jgi:hypothetical protein
VRPKLGLRCSNATHMHVGLLTIYFVEWYPVKRDTRRKYKALMKKIHMSLRQHKRQVPELLSYKTFDAGREGSPTTFVEMFEFANQKSMNKFFGRFSKTQWLRTLQQHFFELVPRRTIRKLTWTELLKDEWLVR